MATERELVFGGTDEEIVELKRLHAEVIADPDSFDSWEKLVRAAEAQEGGLNRNSNPQAITVTRQIYDQFLAKFPLLFGYWKKYADLEFAIAGVEAAEVIYERGVASIPTSVDLWTNYCSFKAEACHEYDNIRELFERGAACVGLDFLSHLFWDKYLEFEERLESTERIFAILGRIIQIPMHQYARYIERYRQIAQTRPVNELAPPELLAQFRAEVDGTSQGLPPGSKNTPEIERDLRLRINQYHMDILSRTQAETNKRWTYESEIKRPYFHVTELDEGQLANWRKYLDFEEAEGNFARIQFLYERCLVTCAFYEEFWLRYARWMAARENTEEDTRSIYIRASTIFVPIARPAVRLQWAHFEEMSGRIDIAKDILSAVLMLMPGHLESIVAMANMVRRHDSYERAVEIYKTYLEDSSIDAQSKAMLIAEWANQSWRIKGSVADARAIFEANQQLCRDSRIFWESYLNFELAQPTGANAGKDKGEDEGSQPARIKHVIEAVRTQSGLDVASVRDLIYLYMGYLLQRGTGAAAIKEYMLLDREVNGPQSVQRVSLRPTPDAAPSSPLSSGTVSAAASAPVAVVPVPASVPLVAPMSGQPSPVLSNTPGAAAAPISPYGGGYYAAQLSHQQQQHRHM
ncbi:hypothetical protein KEM52_003874 [Ascosphaera acerosa]|nr:hypothetical protein KEM52_003874 [Ascosphaera acerosa]